jgi:tRNA dimethylallyltransferase
VPVVAVFGPTASGKSALALELAERTSGEIVSCDAMQLYRGLPVLSNQPSPAELARAPHHLVGVWGLDHEASVAEYAELAHAAVDGIAERGRRAIVAGGTGLYLQAALCDLRLPPQPRPGERERLGRVYDRLGAERAHALLAARDPRAARAVHPNDRRRVVRALELVRRGHTLAPERSALWSSPPRRPTALFGLELPPAELRARIERRCRAMFDAGVEEEVARAQSGGPLSPTAQRMLGLQEVALVIEGRLERGEAARRIALLTARYAKRQRTWMRRLPSLVALDGLLPPAELAERVLDHLDMFPSLTPAPSPPS